MKSIFNHWGFSPTLTLIFLIVPLALSSCMSNNTSDLEQFVEQKRNQAPGPIPALPEIKPYTTYTYDSTALRNPFVAENVGIAQSIEECPQVTHAKDELEMIPLDTLTLVGSLATAMTPLSLIIVGPVADVIGIRTWYVIGGLVTAGLGVSTFFFPAILNIESDDRGAGQTVRVDEVESAPAHVYAD